jgi:hypothetical protein
LLADESTSHRLVSACRRLIAGFPIVHFARWQDGAWLGLPFIRASAQGRTNAIRLGEPVRQFL